MVRKICGGTEEEVRISKAIDVMVKHVENLKRMYEKEHQELEETKRVLQENRLIGDQSGLPKSLQVTPGGGAKDNKGRFQHLLDSTTSSVSSAFRKASIVARRASIAVSQTSPTTPPPPPPPTLVDRTTHFSLSSPAFFQNQRYNRLNSQSSTISTASSDDLSGGGLSSPRHSLSAAIPKDEDDILEEVPMRYPGDGSVSENLIHGIKKPNDPGRGTQQTESPGDDMKCKYDKTDENGVNKVKDSKSESQENKTENNNNVVKPDLEEKVLRRRTIANQIIITDDELEETQEEARNRLSVPRASDDDMVQQALLFQERIKDLIERQDTIDDDSDSGETLLERLRQRVPDWKTFKLRARYTVGGLLFLLGMLCLVMTFIPSTSASTETDRKRWSAVEGILWPFLSVQSLRPHPF